MEKQLKRIIAVVLSAVILLSSILVGSIVSVSADNAVKPDDAPASEFLSETYVFDFDSVREFAVNTDYGIDEEGNIFYPLHSNSTKTTVKQKNFVVNGETITTAEVSAGGRTLFIPTDDNGQPFIIESNTTYTIKASIYTMAASAHGQYFMGGGILASNEKAANTGAFDKNFSLWEYGKNKFTYSSGWNPFYRCTSIGWASNARYYPDVKFETVTNSFQTLDYSEQGGMFYQPSYKNETTPNDDSYAFGQYFGIFFSAGNVNVDGYNGNATYYIDKIEITANRSRTFEVGESYTFNFNEGEVVATSASTKLTDGDGNTFYPYHSQQTGDSFTQANIDVTLKDGTVQTKSTLRYETKGGGYRQYIPTDKNGKPYVLDPNSKYELRVEGYIEKAGGHSQVFFGGGAFHSDQSSYSPLDNTYNGTNSWYFINGTDATKDSGAMVSGYPIYRASSLFWDDITRAFTGFTQTNGDPAQYHKYTFNFTTKDFEEIDNTNHFKAELWQRNKFKNADGTYPDPYTTEGVEIKSESIGQYLAITCGSSDSIFYIDYITITKVSTTDTAEVTFDAQGGTFGDGEATLTSAQIIGEAPSAEIPVNADTTLAFAGWATHPNSDVVSKITADMAGKTLYAVWKPAVSNVTFNANGGTLAGGSATKATTQFAGMKLTEANPTRAGYIFMGWATSANATTPVTVASADMAGKTLYALWKADPVNVTFNANGGKFADGTTSKVVSQIMDAAPSAEAPVRNVDKFIGWGASADATTPVTAITKAMDGTTLYAIYKEAHPANGVYDSWGRTVEFVPGTYKIVADQNTFVPTGAEYGDYRGVPYYSVIADPDEEGDGWLHYYNHYPAGGWVANWCLTPTPTGETNTGTNQESGQVLPTDSTFKMTFRIRVNDDAGASHQIVMYYGTTQGRHTLDVGKTKTDNVTLYNGLAESDEWQTIEMYFTTPKEYATLTNGVANRLFVGVYCANFKVDYDLDYIKIEKISKTDLYVKEDGVYTLKETLYGNPGSEMTLPDTYSEEKYSNYGPKGQESKMLYGNWYFDEDCTNAAIEKFGNFDSSLYCDNVTSVATASTDNQEMFAGFDLFTERTPATVNAKVSGDEYYSGKYSMKAEFAAGSKSSFEVRNDFTMDLYEGITYRVDYMYKANNAAKLELGYADGSVSNGVKVVASANLSATDSWKAGSVVFTANGVSDADILCANVTAENGAIVYIDTMVVSSLTKSVGVEAETTDDGEALRFMLSYNGTDEDTVIMAGKEFTVVEHGVLVKGEDVDTALTLENKNAAGVFAFAQTDMSKNWSVNPITGDTVYSAYLNGFDKTDDYKISARGYVKLADGSTFYTDTLTASVTDIPSAGELIPESANLNDYYVYLPAGTTFPEDRSYNLTTYDDFFTANNAVSDDTLTENSYVAFSARPDADEIDVPSEGKCLVHTGTREELYFGVDYQVVTNDFNNVSNGNVGYIFIADIHFGSSLTDTAGKSILRQTSLIAKMANENDDIDFIVVAGDTTTGMYGSKASAIQWTQAGLDPLLQSTKPVFVAMGNHDDNSYHLLSGSNTNKELYEERIITDLDWQNNIIDRYTNRNGVQVVQDDPSKRENSKYYYYDIQGKNTRVVVLDALDYEARYDENGYVLGDLDGDGLLDGMPINNASGANDSAKYYHGCNYWGYSADQVRWLAEDALGQLPDGYEVIIVSHMGIDYNTNCYGSKVWFGTEMRNVIKAFNAGGTFTANLTDNWGTAVPVNADFSDVNGEIIIWQFGHMHQEMSLYESDVDLWQISTASPNVGQMGTQTYEALLAGNTNNKNLPWRVYTRKWGTETEFCFNVMSVSSDRIYRYTVGEGANEKLVYPN